MSNQTYSRTPRIIVMTLLSLLVIGAIVAGLIVRSSNNENTIDTTPTTPSVSGSIEPQDTDSASPTAAPLDPFMARVVQFMEAFHLEDPAARAAALKNVATQRFLDDNLARTGKPFKGNTAHVIGLDDESTRPVVTHESTDETDKARYVYIGNVRIEKRHPDTKATIIVYEAVPLDTTWILQNGEWMIDSQQLPTLQR